MKDLPVENDIEELSRLASLGELVAGLAHELNNSLSAILAYTEIILRQDIDPGIRNRLDHINFATIRSVKIIEDLLTFARKKEIKLVSLDLNEVIEKTVMLFEYQMRIHYISLKMDLDKSIPFIKGDFYRLQQVFFNIIMNAFQVFEDWDHEREVTISTICMKDKVITSVSDTGPGIPDSRIEKIFRPFYTTKKGGTGLGLSITRGIVKEHGGTIKVENMKEKCSFIMEFPLSAATELKNSENIVSVESSIKDMRILIVDDNTFVLDAVKELLDILGCKTSISNSATGALETVKKHDFDFVMVDYQMPGIDGIELVEKLKDFIKLDRIVLFTGNITPEIEKITERYGISVVRKPIKLENLKNLLHSIAEKKN